MAIGYEPVMLWQKAKGPESSRNIRENPEEEAELQRREWRKQKTKERTNENGEEFGYESRRNGQKLSILLGDLLEIN